MQNEVRTEYSGLNELLAAEKYMKNYNRHIVSFCTDMISTEKSIVDFGAGIGSLSLVIRDMFNISPECVEIDEKNRVFLRDRQFQIYRDIKELNKPVDLVFSSNVLEHIEDDVGALEVVRSKLVERGMLYLYLPALTVLWSELDEKVGHYRRYNKRDLVRKVEQAGFEVQTCHYADSVGFFASLAMKLIGYNEKNGIGSAKSLQFYDSVLFPLSKLVDALGAKFFLGKNIVLIARKV